MDCGSGLRTLLDAVARGELDPAAAEQALRSDGLLDLGFACLDTGREERCGFPEVVFGEHKTPEAIEEILAALLKRHGCAFATRLRTEAAECLLRRWPDARWNRAARTLLLGVPPAPPPGPPGPPEALVVAAGTSDLPVAEEACETLRFAGVSFDLLADVGVAGLHRLLAATGRLLAARILIVVAGMEGALPSVVGGLVRAPVVAVPTSVGYGVSFRGVTALLGMLTSCASGISVVNIDNGFGAALCAARILRMARTST